MHTSEFLAMFIDFDNVFDSFAPGATGPHKLSHFLDYFRERGVIAIKRAYGNWRWQRTRETNEIRYNESELRACAFELTQVFGANAYNDEGKNHADIALALEAFEVALQHPHIQTFVIVSNDSDFMPLISHLHKFGKYVVGVGSRSEGNPSKTGRFVPKAYDEFFYIEDALNIVEDQTRSIAQPPQMPASIPESTCMAESVKGRELLCRTLAMFDGARFPLPAGEFKNTLLKVEPTFKEQAYGVVKFSHWLRQYGDLVTISYPKGDQPYIQPAESGRIG